MPEDPRQQPQTEQEPSSREPLEKRSNAEEGRDSLREAQKGMLGDDRTEPPTYPPDSDEE